MTTTPNKDQIREYLISKAIDYMVATLVEEHNMPLETAIDTVYQSKVISLLQIPDGELYTQSPAYVYELLTKELA